MSFPSSAWGMRHAKLCLANLPIGGESGIGRVNQKGEAELGNNGDGRPRWRQFFNPSKPAKAPDEPAGFSQSRGSVTQRHHCPARPFAAASPAFAGSMCRPIRFRAGIRKAASNPQPPRVDGRIFPPRRSHCAAPQTPAAPRSPPPTKSAPPPTGAPPPAASHSPQHFASHSWPTLYPKQPPAPKQFSDFHYVVPKLCLGMRHAKLCLANPPIGGESGIGRVNQKGEAELGNNGDGRPRRRQFFNPSKPAKAPDEPAGFSQSRGSVTQRHHCPARPFAAASPAFAGSMCRPIRFRAGIRKAASNPQPPRVDGRIFPPRRSHCAAPQTPAAPHSPPPTKSAPPPTGAPPPAASHSPQHFASHS